MFVTLKHRLVFVSLQCWALSISLWYWDMSMDDHENGHGLLWMTMVIHGCPYPYFELIWLCLVSYGWACWLCITMVYHVKVTLWCSSWLPYVKLLHSQLLTMTMVDYVFSRLTITMSMIMVDHEHGWVWLTMVFLGHCFTWVGYVEMTIVRMCCSSMVFHMVMFTMDVLCKPWFSLVVNGCLWTWLSMVF